MKFKKPLIALTLTAAAVAAVAAPTKKELVQKFLTLQQPNIETLARNMAERPAIQLMQAAGQALQTQVPPDKREAVAKQVEADIKKYVEEATPIIKAKAMKLAPMTIGAKLEESFTEDELKQLIAWTESPVNKKFQQVLPQVQDALLQQLAADAQSTFEPRLKTLQQTVAKDLGITITPPPAASTAPATPAKK
ncbi:DUF2059 domain-containing protein [Aquabacterium sp.]|uniref:DUF2059 domain-containing protein n=1 Tax=Aquabacterium sp. TaxID=1872578 RepID=UPI0035AE919D